MKSIILLASLIALSYSTQHIYFSLSLKECPTEEVVMKDIDLVTCRNIALTSTRNKVILYELYVQSYAHFQGIIEQNQELVKRFNYDVEQKGVRMGSAVTEDKGLYDKVLLCMNPQNISKGEKMKIGDVNSLTYAMKTLYSTAAPGVWQYIKFIDMSQQSQTDNIIV